MCSRKVMLFKWSGVSWILLAFCAGLARADDCGPQWLPGQGLPGVDGQVYAQTNWDPDGEGPEPEMLVVGGYFEVAGGVIAHSITAWDGVSWRTLGTGVEQQGYAGKVYALAVYNGELIAGGSFRSAGGVPVSGIARWNGSDWQPLGNGSESYVKALTVYNGELYASARIEIAEDDFAPFITRWDGSQWRTAGDAFSWEACELIVYHDELIAIGDFTSIGDQDIRGIAAWNGSQWRPLGGEIWHGARALAVWNDELIVGGFFTSVGSVRVNYLAAWDGIAWRDLGETFPVYEVAAMAVHNGDLIVAAKSRGVYRYAGTTWQEVEEDIDHVYTLGVYQGSLIAGGDFVPGPNFAPSGVATWSGTEWLPIGAGAALSGPVLALSTWQDKLVAGGYFSRAGAFYARAVASWDGAAWTPLGNLTGPSEVFTLVDYEGELIASGRFPPPSGQVANNTGRWDGMYWTPLPGGRLSTYARAFIVYNGDLIAGGSFTTVDGAPLRGIGRWDRSSWQAIGGGVTAPPPPFEVNALAVYRGDLIAGGYFREMGGTPASGVARWDGQAWHPLGEGILDRVYALAVYNDELIVGGDFRYIGSTLMNRAARWDGSHWHPMGSGLDSVSDPWTTRAVNALRVYGGRLFAGGNFLAAETSTRRIAYWDGVDWRALGGGSNGAIYALAEFRGELIAGGEFMTVDDIGSGNFARWGCPCAPARPADLDRDCDVDGDDLLAFLACASGPGVPLSVDQPCGDADFDGDHDVDQTDFAEIQRCLGADR